MKFFRSIKKSFLTILAGAFLCIALSSCEGFFTDNGVDEKIRAAIDYANAPFSTFVVSVNPLAGKITPSGQVQYKPTDYQNIEFVLNPSYEFIEWSFSYKQISQAADTPTLTAADKNWWKDYITILKETESEPDSKGQVTYNLQIKFDKAAENLLIEPVCVLKPEIKSFSPLYTTSGVPRGSEISVEFNTPIDADSIFFSQSEIDAISGITDVLKNSDRQIYGYKKASKTIFKSIEISLGNDDNIVNDYYSISYNQGTNTLFIKPIGSLEFLADVADVKIKFTDSLKSSAGASMSETYKTICVNKRSDKFATVQIKYNTVDFQSLNNFSVSENQTYQFSDSDNKNQFLYWKIYADANYQDSVDKITVKTDNGISPADQLKKSTITFCANSEISGNEGVRIEAVYKARPAIADGGFSPSDSSTGVPKDTNIEITFTQPVNLDSFIEGYGISISGDDAKAYFESPVLEGDKKIIIKTKSDSKIFVENNTSKIISVKIPGTLYYTASDNGQAYQIFLGADVTKNYRINSSTVDNAQLQFIEDNNTPAVYTYSGIPNRPLNTDDSFTLTLNVNSEYQFLYRWIKENDPDNLVEIIQSESNANAFIVKIKGKCGSATAPVKLTPVVKERLRVTKISPAANTNAVPRDSGINIWFNHAPDLERCKQMIGIYYNGVNVKTVNFPTAGWNIEDTPDSTYGGYKLSIPASTSNRVSVEEGRTAQIQVTFSKDFYYSDSGDFVYYGGEGYSHVYDINSETTNKTTVTFSSSLTGGSITASNQTADNKYSLGRVIPVTFTPSADYEFLYWSWGDDSNITFEDRFNQTTKITVNSVSTLPVNVTAVCTPKLKVESFRIKDTTGDTLTEPEAGIPYPKDSDIVITFNHANVSVDNIKNAVDLSCGASFKDVYTNFIPSWDNGSNTSTLTFTAKDSERIQVTGNLRVTLYNSFYYNYTDSVITSPRRINLAGTENYSYLINSDTRQKATIQVNNVTGGTVKDANGNNFTTASISYSKDQTFTLNFVPNDGYEFIRWNVTADAGTNAADNVSLSSLNDTTTTVNVIDANSGTVTIEPVVVEKLRVTDFIINDGAFNSALPYPKDSTITVTFNKAPDSGLKLTDYILFECGDIEKVYSYFNMSLDGTVLTIAPGATRLNISGPETLKLTIDKNLYYHDDDNDRDISLYDPQGDYSKQILINQTTREKAQVKVNKVTFGEIQDASGNPFNTTETISYSKDEEFTLKYVPRTGFQFKGWDVEGMVDNVELSSLENATTTVKIVGSATGPTTITPKYVEYLAVGKLIINDETFVSSKSYGRDSVIKILFTKTPETPFAKYIKLYCDGREITEKYAIKFDPTDSTKTMVMLIPNIDSGDRVMLNAPANLLITIDDDICYSDETYGTVNLEKNYQETIQLVQETENKAHVTIKADMTNNMHRHISIKVDDGRPSNDIIENEYNLDDQFVLECIADAGYRFIKWEATVKAHNDSSPIPNPYRCVLFSSRTSPVTTVKIDNLVNQQVNQVHQPVGIDVEIKAYCSEDIKVSRINVDNKTFSSSETYPKDSTIKLTFNKDLPNDKQTELFKHIHLKYNSKDVLGEDQYFSIEDIDANNLNQLIIKPNTGKFLPLKNTTDTGVLELTIDKDFFYYQEVASGNSTKMTLGTDYTSTINIDYKSSKSFTINHVMQDAYNNNSACNYGKLTIIPEASDGKYYYGQNLKVKISSINEYYWISSEPSFTPDSTASFDKTLNTNETNRFDTYTFDIVVKSLSDNILTVNSSYKNTFSVLSISPTPATYYENNNPVYPSAVPYDTPIVITFTDELNVKQLLQNNSDNTKYTSEAILQAIFSEFYSYKEGVKISLYTYYTLVDVCYAKYPTVDNSSPRNPTNSSVLVLKPTQKLRELFYKSTGQLVYPPQNTVHITFKQDVRNFVSVKGTDMSKFVKDLTKYDNPGTAPLDISFQIKNSVSATAPDILLSSVYISGSSSPTGRASYLEENAFITATPSTLMSSIPKSCVAKGANGEIYFNFRVSGAGNFGNVMDGIEPTPIKVPLTVEAFTYGKMRRAQYPGDGFVTVPDAQHYIIHYLQYSIQSEDGLRDVGTNFALGGFIDVPAYDCYLIQLNFSFGDINGSVIQKTYYVVYDQDNLYSDSFKP